MALRQPLIVLFDDGLGKFGPLTDLRAVFELRTGALTASERMPDAGALWARPELAALVASRHERPVNAIPEPATEVLLVNGRIEPYGTPPVTELLSAPGVVVERRSGHVIVARLPRAVALEFLESGLVPTGVPRVDREGVSLFARPWEILESESFTRRITNDIATRFGALPAIETRNGVICFGSHPARAHATVRIDPGVIIDTEHGPVVVDAGASVRSGAILAGPCFVGAGTIVAERTLIKSRTVFGPQCRAAGEIGGTIFQGWSNKAHDGHLGDSFIGEWVNLGAGTTNSNLLNTYGEVSLRLESSASIERTGRSFVGAMIGDHVKTAILTRLPTGCVIGTGSMIATTAFVPSLVERFSWLTDGGRRSYRLEKFLEVAHAVWARRKVTASPAMIERLRQVHASCP